MKVQVNKKYTGVFGCFDEECQTVRAKRAGDPPFIVPDDIAEKKIKEGVLVQVDGSPVFSPELPEAVEPAPTVDAPVLEAEIADTEAAEPEPIEEVEEKQKADPKRRKSARK